jgi:hypothetical protein
MMDRHQVFILDHVVFLLSLDWFLDHWQVIGLEASDLQKTELQQHCRRLVGQILLGQPEEERLSYPYDMSDERVAETDRLFFIVVRESGLDAQFSSAVRKLTKGPGSLEAEYYAVKTLAGLNDDIVSGRHYGSGEELASDLAQPVAKTWHLLQAQEPDLRSMEEVSASDWDIFVRNLSSTKLRPWRLSSYAKWSLITPHAFRKFWHSITDALSVTQRTVLVNWYCSTGIERTSGAFVAPTWLK